MKFNTAPMRFKRGPNIFEDLQAEMSGELSPLGAHRNYATGEAEVDRAFQGGSWPKLSKRRTNSDSLMSLREVREAFAAANIASSDDPLMGGAIDEAAFDALDALAAELEDEVPQLDGAAAELGVDVDAFVHAVFDGTQDPSQPANDHKTTELSQDELMLAMLHDGSAWSSSIPTEVAKPTALTSSMPAPALEPLPTQLVPAQPLSTHSSPRDKLEGSARNGAERKEWTAAEDEIIRRSVQVHGLRWRKIAAELPGRSDDAVRNRWSRLKAESAKDGTCSPPGLPSVESGGTAAAAPSGARPRSSSADGGSKPERLSWTRAEDATILQGVQQFGHRWGRLTQRLPGRTEHAIRNRYHRLQTMGLQTTAGGQKPAAAPPRPIAAAASEPQDEPHRFDLALGGDVFAPEDIQRGVMGMVGTMGTDAAAATAPEQPWHESLFFWHGPSSPMLPVGAC